MARGYCAAARAGQLDFLWLFYNHKIHTICTATISYGVLIGLAPRPHGFQTNCNATPEMAARCRRRGIFMVLRSWAVQILFRILLLATAFYIGFVPDGSAQTTGTVQ